MSIEMDNPTTLLEKIDAAANLVGQVRIAVMVGDRAKINDALDCAAILLSDATEIVDVAGPSVADLVLEEDDGEPDY